jgi:hypothetical protein
MHRLIFKIFGLFLLTLFISCTQTIDSVEVLKDESKLKLNIQDSDSGFYDNSVDLDINSTKIKKLRDWIDNNNDSWENSIASYAQPLISLIGENFRMLIFRDFVVIGFADTNDKPRQITRQTDFAEFEFLLEE